MKKLSDLLASPKPVRASLPSDEDELLGQYVEVDGLRGHIDTVTTHAGRRLFHVNCNDGRRLDHVAQSDIEVLRDKR
jgi:hypothetical protein